MTEQVVERLKIRCRGGGRSWATKTQVRLTHIAQRLLPLHLEGALHGWRGAPLESVKVVLDFDPADYDDVTVAALWANRVNAALPPLPAGPSEDGESRVTGSRSRAVRAAPEGAQVETIRRLAAGSMTIRAAADWIHWLADPAWSREILAALSVDDRRRLLRRLETWTADAAATGGERPRGGVTGGVRVTSPLVAEATPSSHAVDGESLTERIVNVARRLAKNQRAVTTSTVPDTDVESVAHDAEESGVHRSSVGGLVLLYPWLARFCEVVTEIVPNVDAITVRRVALGHLAVPDDEGMANDPLVRLLAGDELRGGPRRRAPMPRIEAVDEEAESVLASFASALAGFEGSSPGFIRQEFVERGATIGLEGKTARVTLTHRPLDVVLDQLRYPLGAFGLPWSPTVLVTFVEG